MRLSDHLSLPLVRIPLVAADKDQAISRLVDAIAEQGLTPNRDQLLEAVFEREAQRTTGIGRGFAIPHAKTDAVNRLVIAFGRLSEPIDFASIDGQPVSLIALLASPTHATGIHIQALARLSRMVTNEPVLDALLSAQTADALYRVIIQNDAAD